MSKPIKHFSSFSVFNTGVWRLRGQKSTFYKWKVFICGNTLIFSTKGGESCRKNETVGKWSLRIGTPISIWHIDFEWLLATRHILPTPPNDDACGRVYFIIFHCATPQIMKLSMQYIESHSNHGSHFIAVMLYLPPAFSLPSLISLMSLCSLFSLVFLLYTIANVVARITLTYTQKSADNPIKAPMPSEFRIYIASICLSSAFKAFSVIEFNSLERINESYALRNL